jgi:hypothetical protein
MIGEMQFGFKKQSRGGVWVYPGGSPRECLLAWAFRWKPGGSATTTQHLPAKSRHASDDVVSERAQDRLGVRIDQAIEEIGGLLGVLLGALPGIVESAGLLEMRAEVPA